MNFLRFFLYSAVMQFVIGPSLAAPIRLHPDNPRWFQWHGETIALISSAEHYGAVLNADFDYRTYLDTLDHQSMNYTRIFAGSYVEPQGAFNIAHNTLAPAPGRFLAPWARSDQPGYAGGGYKFDLDQFNPAYLERLHDFIATAADHGVVVELTFFTSTYGEAQWAVHPINPANHIQSFAVTDWKKLHTTANEPEVMAVQEKLVRWLVRELNRHDNLIFEIQNEPWSDNHTMGPAINPYVRGEPKWPNAVELTTADSLAWQRRIARIITDEESRLPQRHLIAQNVANFRLALAEADLAPEVSVINFHYAYPEAVTWNAGLNRAIGYDESGFAGRDDATYRRQAWNFIMSGGGLFNSLDYSFYVGSENGTGTDNQAPGGGSPALRKQLLILNDFIHHFELADFNPDPTFVVRSPGAVARTLSAPGQTYLVYLEGRSLDSLQVALPPGRWQVEWLDLESGIFFQTGAHLATAPVTTLACDNFSGEVAVRIYR